MSESLDVCMSQGLVRLYISVSELHSACVAKHDVLQSLIRHHHQVSVGKQQRTTAWAYLNVRLYIVNTGRKADLELMYVAGCHVTGTACATNTLQDAGCSFVRGQ